ncbi:hypothetical protein SLEP1_g42393 [Rubroshorea leprosula]|uniref:Uncharacterized protein n=1 Tax=Rubroshorea leprosula TaxID=152421 RepID=A0AAV5LA37_9ROSI|nr:hypothetical protein SLEP1_g42393 [Rubroshorea leprosula]
MAAFTALLVNGSDCAVRRQRLHRTILVLKVLSVKENGRAEA